MNIFDEKKVKQILKKIKEEGFQYMLSYWQKNEPNEKFAYSFGIYNDEEIGMCVGYACYERRKKSLSLAKCSLSSADSLDYFFYLYIDKNMTFEDIILKRKAQRERGEKYG